MLDQLSRWIYFNYIKVKPHPEEAPPQTLSELFAKLAIDESDEARVKLIDNEKAAIRIKELSFDTANEIVILLIQYADSRLADPVFSDLKSGTLRHEPKLQGEGIAVSAHIAISMEPLDGNTNHYVAMIEDVPGISPSRLSSFLTSTFKVVAADEFVLDKKKRKMRSIIEIHGLPSTTLLKDLQKGRLSGIKLMQPIHDNRQFDEEGYTSEISREVKLKLGRYYEGDDAVGVLKRVRKTAKQKGYSGMVVQYRRYEGKSKTVDVDTDNQAALERGITQMEKLTFTKILPQCSDSLRDDMVSNLTKMIVTGRSQ